MFESLIARPAHRGTEFKFLVRLSFVDTPELTLGHSRGQPNCIITNNRSFILTAVRVFIDEVNLEHKESLNVSQLLINYYEIQSI